jgi:hypothetical protein
VLATLTLGIGANTAIFSVVNATLLKPLPFHNPGELVELKADLRGLGAGNVGFSVPELDDLRDRAGIFTAVSVVWPTPANLTGGDHPDRLDALAVSPNYFSILGAQPQLGRLFDARDTADGIAEAVVISDSLWHKGFGGDPSVVGRRIDLIEGESEQYRAQVGDIVYQTLVDVFSVPEHDLFQVFSCTKLSLVLVLDRLPVPPCCKAHPQSERQGHGSDGFRGRRKRPGDDIFLELDSPRICDIHNLLNQTLQHLACRSALADRGRNPEPSNVVLKTTTP